MTAISSTLTSPSWFITLIVVSLLRSIISHYGNHSHFSVDEALNLFSYSSLLGQVVVTDDTSAYNWLRGLLLRDYVRHVLRLRYGGHKLIQLIVTVGFNLLEEIIHFQCLSVAWYLSCSEHVRSMLTGGWSHSSSRDAHVVLLLLKGVFLPRYYIALADTLFPITAYSCMTRVI